MGITKKVETAPEFKSAVVDRDYEEYKKNPTCLRLAYHLALGLLHLRDWTFEEHSGSDRWPYKFKEERKYQEFLAGECKYFGFMRDLANAVKHMKLKKWRSTKMEKLADTELMGPAFQPSAFQGNAFQTHTMIVSEIAPGKFVQFEPAADAVMAMWNDLFSKNGWN